MPDPVVQTTEEVEIRAETKETTEISPVEEVDDDDDEIEG